MPNALLDHFAYKHVNQPVPEVTDPFLKIAQTLDEILDESAEKTNALRKLLEASDSAIRARLMDLDNRARDERINEVKHALYPHMHKETNGHG